MDIRNADWQVVTKKKSADEMADAWTDKFINLVEKNIPTKMVKISKRDSPWVTNKLKKEINRRNRLYTIAKEKNSEHAWNRYREYRNQVKDEIRAAKEVHTKQLETKINEAEGNDEKTWWSLVKEIYSKKKSSCYTPLEIGNQVITDSEEKANQFNKFFITKSKLQEENRIPDTSQIPDAGARLEDMNISYLTVKKILSNLKINKASGPDGISPRMLKNTANEIAPILAQIFNFSFKSGNFPAIWKKANITPLYKSKGSKSETKNYRPVSLLSSVGKVMERCIHNIMFKFLSDEKLLTKFQAAYTPNSSTETQLLDIYHHIISALDGGKDMRFLFLDMSAAFDKVWHTGLLAKLDKHGIHRKLLKWIKDYLSDRKQRVVIEGKNSEYIKLTSGVPQGSILGPLLFLVYINDMPRNISTNIRLYADDSTLFIDYAKNKENDDAQVATRRMQEDIHRVEDWAHKWQIEFNPTKTESLVFS